MKTTRCEKALRRILTWCEAYPLDIFPPPDLEGIRQQIGDTQMAALHATWARHLLGGISRHARHGLGVVVQPSEPSEQTADLEYAKQVLGALSLFDAGLTEHDRIVYLASILRSRGRQAGLP